MTLSVNVHCTDSHQVEGLRRDLLVWSTGLFPFFQFAATSVRPHVLRLYETYYLPLGENLRPATKAFILALLPGMEEESGDHFDNVRGLATPHMVWALIKQVMSLLSRLSEALHSSFFLQNMFIILISSPSSRLASLNYLSRTLLQPSYSPEAKTDIGLFIRGIAAVLGDENMLVRRNGLDILLRLLKLDGAILM
jgi:hypothetical protein